MAPPKRAVQRVGVLTRFEPGDLALIDRVRGPVSRQEWVASASVAAARLITSGPVPVVLKADKRAGPKTQQQPGRAAAKPIGRVVGYDRVTGEEIRK